MEDEEAEEEKLEEEDGDYDPEDGGGEGPATSNRVHHLTMQP